MGLTVLDAGVLIGFLDGDDPHHLAARTALDDSLRRGDTIVLPASAYAEALVGPARRGAKAVETARRVVDRIPIEIAPLDADVALEAASLRSRHATLKLPDALVIATAIVFDADCLITTDRRWPTRSRLGLRAALDRL